MLLFLVSAVLAIPICTAQEMQGRSMGGYFYIKGEEQGEIKGVRVFMSYGVIITGIQLQFGDHWSDFYGVLGGRPHEFLLDEGEQVIEVTGSWYRCIQQLTLITNKRRHATFGRRSISTFANRAPPGHHLVTVNGVYSPELCILGIGFKWGHGLQERVSRESPKPAVSPDTSRPKDEEKDEAEAEGGDCERV